MRLLVICALVIGLAIQSLIGLLTIARDLHSDSIFGVPTESDEQQSVGDTGPKRAEVRKVLTEKQG